MSRFKDHPLRRVLNDEVHARPHAILPPPFRATHVAVVSGEGAEKGESAHVAELCALYGAPAPPVSANFWSADLGRFRLRWERHTEFSTYTFLVLGHFDDPFAEPAIARVPADWLANLQGERLVAVHAAIEAPRKRERTAQELAALFGSEMIVGSRVSGGAATVLTDFRIGRDGYSRILVRDEGLHSGQAGRLLQRLFEIETYRMMALLALPVARETGPRITRIDRKLAALTTELARIRGLEDEQSLLETLTRLAAEVERLSSASAYRFSAARAYHALVERRIEELRERRIGGRQTIGAFMARRLDPAMRTCRSVEERQEILSRHIARTSDLLRARVDVALERQNRDLLATMARRARLQLRLQETVEGLSVVAITYYVVGLVGYGLDAVRATGAAVDAPLVRGLAIPAVALVVWLGARWLRRALRRESRDGAS